MQVCQIKTNGWFKAFWFHWNTTYEVLYKIDQNAEESLGYTPNGGILKDVRLNGLGVSEGQISKSLTLVSFHGMKGGLRSPQRNQVPPNI